ncbi:MAG: DUF1552 domain-containing protein [Deltaproteobacteria bacterium]|nr:DUF1552 domain-containing protein [Deltaproteobacteria bacterium]
MFKPTAKNPGTESRWSRRRFLSAAGLSGAFLPLLGTARADGAAPKRLVTITWTGGIRKGNFWPVLGPTGGETDWRLCMPGEGPSFAPFTMPVLEPVVKDFRKDMIILAAMDSSAFIEGTPKNGTEKPGGAGGHDHLPCLLTGTPMAEYRDFFETAGGPSIDQVVGRAVAERANLPFHALVLGGRTGTGYQATVCYAGKGDGGITPETNPARLFKTLFQGRNLGGEMFDKNFAAQASVLDYLSKDLSRFVNQFGAPEKQKAQSHFDAIRDLERQFSAPSAVSCALPAQPAAEFKGDAAYPALLKAQFDLLTVALKCDLTRVATFNLTGSGGDDIHFPWLGQEFTEPTNDGPGSYKTRHLHEISHSEFHGGAYARRHALVARWFWEQVAYFLGRLRDTPEGNGTMLDNTVVAVVNHMGLNHAVRGIPVVLFGSCGGYFKTGGRLIRYGDHKLTRYTYFWGEGDQSDANLGPRFNNSGVSMNRLLASLGNAMDVPMATFGDPRFGGELTELKA